MSKNLKILLVDDEVDILEPLSFNLEASGYYVKTAQSGNQAARMFQQEDFDAIVSDIKMPDGDGIELLKNVKKVNPLCSVVSFITGYSDLTPREAYHLGASGTFSKPFDFAELIKKIEWSVASADKRWGKPLANDELVLIKNTDSRSIGSGGVSLHIDGHQYNNLQINTLVGFQFESKLGKVSGHGWVRWFDERHGFIGVEFAYLAEDCLQKVGDYLKKEKPVPYIPKD